MSKPSTTKTYWSLVLRTCTYTGADRLLLLQTKLFDKKNKTKRGLELVSWSHFLHDFLEKNFAHAIFFYLTKSLCLIGFTLVIFSNMCIVIVCCWVYDTINVEINHNFLIKPFSYVTTKFRAIQNKNSLYWDTQHFFVIFKEFQ